MRFAVRWIGVKWTLFVVWCTPVDHGNSNHNGLANSLRRTRREEIKKQKSQSDLICVFYENFKCIGVGAVSELVGSLLTMCVYICLIDGSRN